ncbi:hypothetical protein [Vibrio algivorus]|uniref:Uncharacterized protein n=1 Tax=Vibrio algivorus TaxID=1667024 RepID=A0A557PGX9_9VIBR|nr:hypothetical protein [Vibrio algivorus]TVO39913.1 hypothetical protein FOF44_00130 [Vibrio algivorus]
MNIEEKLELVKNSKVIVGIKEGVFVRFYEQSLFGWQQWVLTQPQLPTLKVLIKKVKKLDNQEIVYGGLPIESLIRSGIDVGNENTILLKDEIDFSNWDNWRAEQKNEMNNIDSPPLLERGDNLNDGVSNSARYIRLFLPEHLVKKALETKDTDPSLVWLLRAVKQAASF